MRELDPRALRAITHPLRIQLLDLVERRGTLTSAEASTETGESTGSCSFHLRQLARYGFLEAAPARNGRERRWRRVGVGEHVGGDAVSNDSTVELARLVIDRVSRDALAWVEQVGQLDDPWRDGGVLDQGVLYLSPEELRGLSRAVTGLFGAFRERTTSVELRPQGAQAVRFASLLFPLAESDGDQTSTGSTNSTGVGNGI